MGQAWRSKGVNSWAWEKIRRAVLDRDGYQCRLRIDARCAGRANTVHHLLGKGVTPDTDTGQLVSACARCNFGVGKPDQSTAYTAMTAW